MKGFHASSQPLLHRVSITLYAFQDRLTQTLFAPLAPSLRGTRQRVGLGLTAALILSYVIFLGIYLARLQQTLGTHAEDLGIMDQVLWNTTHGNFWHQTICDPINDTNCLGDVSRWAIHFEPLMLALVPLYWLFPGTGTLQIVQVIGVGLGAIPAYMLASRRMQSASWGVVGAAAYLLMPMLRDAVVFDFHMVTLAAPLLMLALLFFFTRNDRWLIITCLLAMGTKEQVPLDVFMIGLAVLIMQKRARLGWQMMGMAVAWAVVALCIIHLASPLGASPTADRYDDLRDVLGRVPLLVADPLRRSYFLALLANTGGVGIFAPWALLLALPSILLNALSADQSQFSGLYQYNADIVPFLWLAMMEGAFLLARRLRGITLQLRTVQPTLPWMTHAVVVSALFFTLFSTTTSHFVNPYAQNNWPQTTYHTTLARKVLAMVPATASVSAQSALVPHLSERHEIYLFPSGSMSAQFIVLDTFGELFPFDVTNDYVITVHQLIASGTFAVLFAANGFLVLERITPPILVAAPIVTTPSTAATLPANFCRPANSDPSVCLLVLQSMTG
jgi:uncharacterized membrane protein